MPLFHLLQLQLVGDHEEVEVEAPWLKAFPGQPHKRQGPWKEQASVEGEASPMGFPSVLQLEEVEAPWLKAVN